MYGSKRINDSYNRLAETEVTTAYITLIEEKAPKFSPSSPPKLAPLRILKDPKKETIRGKYLNHQEKSYGKS